MRNRTVWIWLLALVLLATFLVAVPVIGLNFFLVLPFVVVALLAFILLKWASELVRGIARRLRRAP